MTILSLFHARSTALEVVHGHELSGKTVLITGASSGIGVETARALVYAGAEVILAVRDASKGAAVGPELAGTGGLYLEDCHEAEIISPENANTANRYVGYMPYARSPESAERLWCVTQEMIGE